MTFDDNPDPDDLDELASAVVDGEATEAEREQVAADPDLAAREQLFREIADRVAQVPSAEDAARESTLAAVLAAAAAASGPPESSDGPSADPGTATASGAVVPLVRRSRGRSWRFVPAVAAVVIVLLAIPALLIAFNRDSGVSSVALSSGDTATSSSAAEAASSPSTTVASTTTSITSSPGSGLSGNPTSSDGPTLATPLADLGTLRSSGELGASVKKQLDQTPPTTGSSARPTTTLVPTPTGAPTTTTTVPPLSGTPPPSVDCESAIRGAVSGLGDLLLRATATYQDAPTQVYGFDDPRSDGTIVIVTDASTCAILEQTAA